jgi:putative salt-induced outer membrane protein YdiY
MDAARVQRVFTLAGVALLFLAKTALSQEPQAGLTPYLVAPQFQDGSNQLAAPLPTPLADAQPAYQSALPPPGAPSQTSLPTAQAQPQPAQLQLPAPANASPMLPQANNGSVQPSSQIVVPATAPPPKLWEGGMELGLNGTEGNSQTFNLHVGAKLKRKTEFDVLSSELNYKKNSSDSIETANQAFLESRFEHLFQQSRWTWFIHNIDDYDEFKAYDLRVAIDAGCGYQLIKSDLTSLVGRFGGGTTREIGGPDDRFIPELVFGLEGEHKISKRQKLSASVECRPDVTDFTNYRLYTKAAWEVLLDEEKHLSMKVSLLDRYDSYADGRKPNDLDYALTLLWSF